MSAAMHHYFDGEFAESFAFAGVGAALGGTSVYLLTRQEDFSTGMAIPLIAIGVIQLAAGVVLWARTPGQVADLDAQLEEDPEAYREAELDRMLAVNHEFELLEATEIMLAIAGAITFALGLAAEQDVMTGIGVGTTIQSLAMLVLDLLAKGRAERYIEALEAF